MLKDGVVTFLARTKTKIEEEIYPAEEEAEDRKSTDSKAAVEEHRGAEESAAEEELEEEVVVVVLDQELEEVMRALGEAEAEAATLPTDP